MKIMAGITLAILFLALSFPVSAQDAASKTTIPPTFSAPRNITIDDYFEIRDIGQPELSPDGQWVAYVVRTTL